MNATTTLSRRVLRAATSLTTPFLPDDYLVYLNPLWSTREPRGRVEAVVPETRDSATLWIRTPSDFPAHTPGQYVRVGVDIEGVRHWRTYSLTSVPGSEDRRIAITVKAIPDGFVSKHLVHQTTPGTIVRLAPPAGEFVLPDPRPRKLLFVTAGSGITPVMGMLRAHRDLEDAVHVHLSPSEQDTIFAAELRLRGHELHLHHDDTHGLFSVERLSELVPDLAERDTWACGPAGLLDALSAHFERLGCPERLNLERFRPVVAAAGVEGAGGTVSFLASDKTVEADGTTPLLVVGEEAGALMPSGCRMGICMSCVGRLCSGTVRDLRSGELIEADPTEPDLVRMCVSAAAGPVEIDL